MIDPLPIAPFTAPVHSTIRLPGSKSITNRALLLAALADSETTLEGVLFSEDTLIMAEGLRRLGFNLQAEAENQRIQLLGTGGEIPAISAELFVGLAGTAARFLTALCCLGRGGSFRMDGTAQMRERPMKSLIDALQSLGAKISSAGGFLPLNIDANGLHGGEVALDATQSSQLLSALLMVAPFALAPLRIRLTDPGYRREYVAMTLRMMEQFGQRPSNVSKDGLRIDVDHGTPYRLAGGRYIVEPDASAASYFLTLPLVAGGEVSLPGLPEVSLQGDMAFADRVSTIGAIVARTPEGVTCQFDRATAARAQSDNYHAISDTFLTMAAISPLLDGVTRITGIAHTRHQETDRIAGMAKELRRLGQHVIEEPGALEIHPRPLVSGLEIETYGDHRFAMSFGILGCHNLHGDGRSWLAIKNPACCAKTFPDFFNVLEGVRCESMKNK